MNDVIGKEDRNLHPAAQRRFLHRPVVMPGHRVEGAANVAGRQLIENALARHVPAYADQPQLADLFFQRHLFDQAGDERRLVIQQQGAGLGGD